MTDYNEIRLNIELNYGLSTFGTCDRLTIKGTKALLADYKTGVSQIDHPSENWQSKAYTIGVFDKFPEIDEVTFVFYIPFYNDTPNYTFHRDDLPKIREEVSRVIARATYVRSKWSSGSPSLEELSPNQNCRFCHYEDSCPALGGMVLEVADKLGSSVPEISGNDDPSDLEALWSVAKVVTNWANAFRKNLVERVKDGDVSLPSLRLKSMGTPKKCNDNGALVSVAQDFGVDEGDILEIASIPLGRLTKKIEQKADKGTASKESLSSLRLRSGSLCREPQSSDLTNQ
jgi:hypothetical protein